MSFRMAGILAFRTVSTKARPVLLEPIMAVEVWAPSDLLGDVLGDLSPRRGQILSTEQDGRLTKVNALVPRAELYRYSTALHSITHGRGTHRERFHGYAEAPPKSRTRWRASTNGRPPARRSSGSASARSSSVSSGARARERPP